jgi:hypothetical protein
MKIKRTRRKCRDGKHRNGHAYDRIRHTTTTTFPLQLGKLITRGSGFPHIYCKDDGAASHEFLYEINQEKEVVASVRMRRGRVWDTDDHVKSEGCIEVDRCATPCPRVA